MSALQITYQITLAEGQTVAFEIGAHTEDGPGELQKVLDMVGSAAERRKAINDLPFHKARLMSNRELLLHHRKERAKAQATMDARVVQMSANRRNQAPPTPVDINTVSQFDARILEIEKTIRGDELRIPYLEAIIAGREPPDLFPEVSDPTFMAAAE